MRGRAVVALITLAMVAGACSVSEEPPERIQLTVVMAPDWGATAPVLDAVRDFEGEHPGVQVNIERLPFNQIPDILESDLVGGRDIHLVHWHAFAAGRRGLAEPIDDLWGASELTDEEFLPGAAGFSTWEGTRYGVPLDVAALTIVVNRDLLAQVGINDPAEQLATWEGFLEAGQMLHEAGIARGISFSSSTWRTHGWLASNGGSYVTIDEDGTPHVSLDSPEAIETFQFLQENITSGAAFPPSAADHSRDSTELFRAGETAMLDTGAWDLAEIDSAEAAESWVQLPLPEGPSANGDRGTALGGSSLFLPRGAEHRELAFELAVHLIRDEYALRYAIEEGRMPVRRRVYDDPFFDDEVYRTIIEELEIARPELLLAFGDAAAGLERAINDILAHEAPVAPTLQREQERLDDGDTGNE